MRLAIQPSLLPGRDLDERFDAAVRYGFDAVEITADLLDRVEEVEGAMAASGLPVCAICTGKEHDPLVPDPAERARRFATLGTLLELADALGAAGVVSVPVRPPHVFPDLADRDRELTDLAVEAYGQLATSLSPGTARLFLEPLNRYETYFLNTVEQAAGIVRRIGHPRVQALADLYHMNIEESSLAEPLTAAGADLGHVHVADNTRRLPGTGRLEIASAVAALSAMDYQGYISLECYHPRGTITGDPETALPASVQYLRATWEQAGPG